MTNEQAAAVKRAVERMRSVDMSYFPVYPGGDKQLKEDCATLAAAYLAEHPPVPADTAADARQAAERAAEKVRQHIFDISTGCRDGFKYPGNGPLTAIIEAEFAPLLAAKDAVNSRYRALLRRCAIVSGSMGGTLQQQDREMDEAFAVDPDNVPDLVVSRVMELTADRDRLKDIAESTADDVKSLIGELELVTVERDRLAKQVEELTDDAKRYAYIRDELAIGKAVSWKDTEYRWSFEKLSGKHKSLDATIDAALQEQPND